MICKFIRDKDHLDKVMEDFKKAELEEGHEIHQNFTPPNLAIFDIRKNMYYIYEVPREEVSKFNTYMHDIWK